MTLPITRKIINLGDRLVHVRFCGNGPPALILHQSPRTSEEMEPLMQMWGAHFTCIAPDHPGYGFSDPLANPAPNIDDFAQAIVDVIDHLGIGPVPIYGHHTGAKIALALGVNHPDKVSTMVLNGLLVNTQADRDDLAQNYLPSFVPSHDASHLMQLWWRMREQTLFFPWYNRKAEARMAFGIRPPEAGHEACMDFLSAGDNYRRGYGAALATICLDYIDKLTVKTVITAVKVDPLWVDVGRITPRGPVDVQRFDDMDSLYAMSLAAIRSGARETFFETDSVHQDGKRQVSGGCAITLSDPSAQPRVVAIPDLGYEIACEQDVLDASPKAIMGTDPSGHGPSSKTAAIDPPQGIETILTFGLGAVHVPKLMARYPGAKVVAADLLLPAQDEAAYLAAYIPAMAPQANGAHLATAFLASRSALVFWPWHQTEPQYGIPGEHLLDADALHIKTRALLRGWRAGQAKLQDVPAAMDALVTSSADVTIALPDWTQTRADIRKDYGTAKIVYYPFKDRAAALSDLL